MLSILQLDPSKNLTSQCVQGCGQVQVNVEIKTLLGGMSRINITDVLKPADSDDEEIPKLEGEICRFCPKTSCPLKSELSIHT